MFDHVKAYPVPSVGTMDIAQPGGAMDATAQIDGYVDALVGWQREAVIRLRGIILDADPAIVEEWKWGTPVFSREGTVCAIGTFKDHVKINFFKGASLDDPEGLFNAGLDAKASRAITWQRAKRSKGQRSRNSSARQSPATARLNSLRVLSTSGSLIAE